MKNNLILIVLITLLFHSSSCSQNAKRNKINDNLLLAKEVTSSCVVNIANTDTPEWTKGFDRISFFMHFFDLAMSGKANVYGYAALGDTINRKIYLPNDLAEKMKQHVDTTNFDLLKEIRFLENWTFDKNTSEFKKVVKAWTPIKIWDEDGVTKKQMIGYAYPVNPKKGKLIAKDIFYEHTWYQEYPNLYTGFDQLNFLKTIVDKIKSGEIAAYDPIYLVDKSKRKFTPKELEAYIEEDLVPISLDNLMNSILFEEDWYFDENTLGIMKDVKSIAFVGFGPYDEATNTQPKKILFFLFPK